MSRLLLCTDLDRTLLPNGPQAESKQARDKFSQLVSHPEVTLVFVTGRHQQLVQKAIEDYKLPQPDYVIADVGSSLYEITDHQWRPQQAWEDIIRHDWQGKTTADIHQSLHTLKLTLQEESKQSTHKLSYYVPVTANHSKIISEIKAILQLQSIAANLIWSIDEQHNIGLLDLLPASAGKRQAIEFLMDKLAFSQSETVFAGDSGNDICVMSSAIQSVLVANATNDIRDIVMQRTKQNNQQDTLYLAKGNFMGMNGNYSAGILEGIVHYIPQADHWLRGEK